MGFWSWLFGQSSVEDEFRTIDKQIKNASGKLHLAGTRGQVLHPFARAIFTNLHFRQIQTEKKIIDKDLEMFKENIKIHMVVNAEKNEVKTIKALIKEYSYLYMTLHNIMLYELNAIKKLEEFVTRFKKFSEDKPVPDELKKAIVKMALSESKEWKDDIENLRQMINSIFEKSEGKAGTALTIFNKMHEEGFFIRFQERKHFREILKDEQRFEATFSALLENKKVKNWDQFKAALPKIEQEEKEIADDFEVLHKALFNTWDNIIKLSCDLVKVTDEAVKQHELPGSEEARVHVALEKIQSMTTSYLHGLRIEDKQLEGSYSNLLSAINDLKRTIS
jgi:uncharacterized protein YdhG (YjbR/CyaY superfamily)